MLNPVIHALPLIAGIMAGRPSTDVVDTIRPWNCEPIMDSWIIASPTAICPRAANGRAASAGSGRAAIGAPGDDTGVAGDFADPFEGSVELNDGNAANARVFRVDDLQLLAQRAGFARPLPRSLCSEPSTRIPKLRRVDDRVEHPSVGHINSDSSEARHLNRGVEAIHETGHVFEFDRATSPIATFRDGLHRPGRRVDHHDGLGLLDRHDTGFEDDGDRADEVRARHGHVFRRLHDDDADIATRVIGGVGVHVPGNATPRLAQ